MEGILLFNKPQNLTSFQIVNFFKKNLNKKTGHGGTLDPLAEGLLIIGIGRATKDLTKFLKNAFKVYIGEIVFGYTSSTYDREGKITFVSNNFPTLKEIESKLKEFSFNYYQKPPLFSAIKFKGMPLYRLIRKGIEPKILSKKVALYDFEILDYSKNILKLKIKVSSGFYVRSLANDLGEKLKCGAYLNKLIREKIILKEPYCQKQEFLLKEALDFKDIKNNFLETQILIFGKVQGVGFRSYTYNLGKSLNLKGWVKNLEDGSLKITAQGKKESLSIFIEKIKKGPPLSQIEKSEIIIKKPLESFFNFDIIF